MATVRYSPQGPIHRWQDAMPDSARHDRVRDRRRRELHRAAGEWAQGCD